MLVQSSRGDGGRQDVYFFPGRWSRRAAGAAVRLLPIPAEPLQRFIPPRRRTDYEQLPL